MARICLYTLPLQDCSLLKEMSSSEVLSVPSYMLRKEKYSGEGNTTAIESPCLPQGPNRKRWQQGKDASQAKCEKSYGIKIISKWHESTGWTVAPTRQPRNPPLQQKVICSFTFMFWDPRLPCLISPPRRSLTIPECSPAYLHNYIYDLSKDSKER